MAVFGQLSGEKLICYPGIPLADEDSVLIYVEFGAAFPFNGAELIYVSIYYTPVITQAYKTKLDEVFRRPELLTTVLYSAFFVLLSNTVGNCLQFAKHVLLAADPSITNTEDLDRRLVTFIAIVVLTAVCLLHYFSRNSGLLLNILFALYKVFLIIVFIIRGSISSESAPNGRNDWGNQSVPNQDPLAALIYVIYSYQGWENANYVSYHHDRYTITANESKVGGELKVASRDLKWGAFLAVVTVTILYSLVTVAYV